MRESKKLQYTRFSNEQILFLSVIAILLIVILFLGITIVRNQLPYQSAPTRDQRYHMRQVRKLGEVYGYILEHYVESVDADALLNAAMQGMIGYLEDPYSEYVVDAQATRLKDTIQGDFGGLGLSVSWDKLRSQVVIAEVYPNHVAQRVGLRVGDALIAVDQQSVVGQSLDEIINLMRGRVGSKVQLQIDRDGTLHDFSVHRERIMLPTVLYQRLDEQLVYLKITQFTPHTAAQLEAALKEISEKGVTQLIIDLRNNPGGELESVVKATDLFLSKGLIVQTYSRSNIQSKIFKANAALSVASDVQISVIINQHTASAAEVMAGALQDLGRATIYGRQSFGKASVQVVLPLSDRPAEFFKLTVAHYLTASGHNISKEGISPDVKIPATFRLTQEELKRNAQLLEDEDFKLFLAQNLALPPLVYEQSIDKFSQQWQLPLDFIAWQVAGHNLDKEGPRPLVNLEYDYTLASVIEHLRGAA